MENKDYNYQMEIKYNDPLIVFNLSLIIIYKKILELFLFKINFKL